MLDFDRREGFKEDKVREVMNIIREYQLQPLVVKQRVLAIHPKTKELRTASLLTADGSSYHHAQFDRTELGTMMINDTQLIPITEG